MTGGIDMSKKESEKSKDSEGLQSAIKKFFRVKGSGSCCCKIGIEEVEEEKTEDKAKTTEKK